MGYKKMKKNLGFADFALANSLKHNRSLKLMDKLNSSLNWDRIQSVLMSHYTVGTSAEGADAYPPLLLFKCLMLQKWFRINSDPELENQINDRLSFKKFLQLPLDKPSPDHSTFSRFRSRLSKDAMDQLNSEILRQFEGQGLTINEGIAVDARLVQSASRPLSNDELKKQRDKRNTPEGKLDKNGKPLKFCRDLESDWTVKNDVPHFGLKEHATVDTINPAEKYVFFSAFYAMKSAWKKSMHENSVLMLNNRFAIKLFDSENKVENIAKSVPLPVSIVPPV